MALTVNVALNVPPLPENDIWFANAQAWSNYWRDIDIVGTLEPADTTVYASSPYDNSLIPLATNIDGTDYVLITLAMFTSLKNRLDVLNAAFEDMRTQMKDAGYISNAQ